MKKVLHIDMDGVVVDFISGVKKVNYPILENSGAENIPGIFGIMDPMPGAIEAIELLAKQYDIYFLSTPPWNNDSAWTDKVAWIKKYFPVIGIKRLILTHNKGMVAGDYLIDDRIRHGVENFKGEHIHFGHGKYQTWKEVLEYLK